MLRQVVPDVAFKVPPCSEAASKALRASASGRSRPARLAAWQRLVLVKAVAMESRTAHLRQNDRGGPCDTGLPICKPKLHRSLPVLVPVPSTLSTKLLHGDLSLFAEV